MKNTEYSSPEVIIIETIVEGILCMSGESPNSNNSNLFY